MPHPTVPSRDGEAPDPWTLADGERRAPWWAWAGAALVALLVAASVGVAAGLFRREDFWLVAAVFTVCVLPPAFMLGWYLVVLPRTNAPEPHAEENVERRWTERAAAGAFWDVLIVAGLTLAAVSLTGLQLSVSFALAVVVLVAMVDFFVRHAVVSRRES